ncbi:hypothetical protein [Seohaeicola zhoushanensis]|uniref:Uncharacterized protein n=1 Tax=Seohaeicola zhoushanensis TaxID=1569283 RepID=A0A8J3M708_9RHOB|nr:hypothetical protein [Seohaeicola zhoushanensis]GHF33427.1 hypothetical protein GCM10017056_01050 [Seohaeicola zhoushanensis]
MRDFLFARDSPSAWLMVPHSIEPPIITATLTPSGTLYDGENAADDLANFASYDSSGNYASSAGTIVSAVYQVNEVTVATNTVLSVTDVPSWLVTDSEGNFRRFSIPAVQDIAPTQNAAPSASGDAVVGESPTGTPGTFNGTNLVEISEWEVSDDGSTGWTGTGDTDTSGPPGVFGENYRFASTATNSAGSLTTYSDVIGPVALPVLTINGLTGGDAVIGSEAGITVTSDIGTITSTSWGTEAVEDLFGTGANPTSIAGGDGVELVVSVVIGGNSYETTALIRYNAPVAASGLSNQSWPAEAAITAFDVSADFTVTGDASLVGVTFTLDPTSDPLPAGLSLSPAGLITGTPTTEAAAVTIVVRGTNSGGNATTTFDITISAASTAETIIISSISPMDENGNVDAAYAVSANLTAEGVVFEATEANPGAADFNGGGAPTYVDIGTVALTTTGTDIELAIPSGLAKASRKLALLPPSGTDGDVAVSTAVIMKTVAPVLSSVSFTDNDNEGILYAFTPDDDSAPSTDYRLSFWADGTNPSDALIASGTGSVSTLTGAAVEDTEESGEVLGLGAATYQPTIYYKDKFGNEVWETYADVVVASSSVTMPTVTEVLAASSGTTGTAAVTNTIPAGAADATKEVLIEAAWGEAATSTGLAILVDGNAPTLIEQDLSNRFCNVAAYYIAVPAGGNLSLSIDQANPTGQWRGISYRISTVVNRNSAYAAVKDYDPSYGALDVSQDTYNGETVRAIGNMYNLGTTGDFTPTGLTVSTGRNYPNVQGTKRHVFYEAAPSSTEIPRTMTLTPTGDGSADVVALSVVIR